MRKVTVALVSLGLLALLVFTACIPMPGAGGGGMMGDRGGMMGPGMMGPGMMGGSSMMSGMMGYYPGVPTPLSRENARAVADSYLSSLNAPGLGVGEFEEYSHNFYVSLLEKDGGRGAVEVVIDRYSGRLQPEPPGMMWNRKYGMMGGPLAPMTVTRDQALEIAQDFLDVAYPGTAAGEITAYYGYYTVMTTREGRHHGMLSVNGYSGEIWYHTWHGGFISEVDGH